MENCLKTLRDRLYSVMGKKNWTLVQMATECGISYRELQQILYNQNKDIRLSTLIRISEGLGVPLISLVDVEEMRKEENAEFISKLYSDMKEYLRKSGVEI